MDWIKDRMPDNQYCIGALKKNNGEILVCQIRYDINASINRRIVTGNYGWVGGADYYSEKDLVAWMPKPDPPTEI